MNKTLHINRVSRAHNREIYEGEDYPPFVPGFDTWLHLKCLNIQADYPWVSFNRINDFAGVPRPYSIIINDKSIPGYYITFKDSALSMFSTNYKNYMKVHTNSNINMVPPNGMSIFFPESAYHLTNVNPSKLYIDGPRPTYIGSENPFLAIGYDTWINMSNLGGNYPWVAFNRTDDLMSSPPPNIDHDRYSGFAIKFKPNIISHSKDGMRNPVEVDVMNNNVTTNQDGSITITVPKDHYIHTKLPHEINIGMDALNNQNPVQVEGSTGGPYVVNLHMWV